MLLNDNPELISRVVSLYPLNCRVYALLNQLIGCIFVPVYINQLTEGQLWLQEMIYLPRSRK